MNVIELEGFTLLHVATRGDTGAAASALSTRLGVTVDSSPGGVVTRNDGTTVLWFGPSRWLIHAPAPGFQLEPVDGCAVTDLSDSRRLFRLIGADVQEFLSASCPLDLSETNMPAGSCALTQFDRFSILLYRQARDSFAIYVERSYVPALGLQRG